jgi:drug/metabolite transporter (DMT)-like permease
MQMTQHTDTNQELSFLAAIFTVFLCTVFGANAVAIKISFSGLGVFTTAGIRFSMAAVAIFLWVIATRRPLKIKKGQIHQLLIISVLFAVQLSMFYVGLSKTHASRGTLLINIQPFLVLLLAHFFIPNDRITKRKVLGILMAFSGVAFVFLEKKGITSDFQKGDIIILSATFLWAASAVYTKKILESLRPFQVVLFPVMFAGPFCLLAAFLFDDIMVAHLNLRVLGALIYQGLITASFGFVAWNTMLQKYGAVSLHSFLFIMPIAGVILGGVVLGEPVTFKILLALAMIVSGISIVQLKSKKEIAINHPGKNV